MRPRSVRTPTPCCAKWVCQRNKSRSCTHAAWWSDRKKKTSAQRFHQIDVLLHRVVAVRSLDAVPRIPFGTTHHVAKAGFLLAVVTHAALFVERVELEQRGIVGALAESFGLGYGSFELRFQIGHRDLQVGVSAHYRKRWLTCKIGQVPHP